MNLCPCSPTTCIRGLVLQATEETYLELPFFTAFWAGVGREIVKTDHNSYVASLSRQSRYVVICDVFRNKRATVADCVPLLLQGRQWRGGGFARRRLSTVAEGGLNFFPPEPSR